MKIDKWLEINGHFTEILETEFSQASFTKEYKRKIFKKNRFQDLFLFLSLVFQVYKGKSLPVDNQNPGRPNLDLSFRDQLQI